MNNGGAGNRIGINETFLLINQKLNELYSKKDKM